MKFVSLFILILSTPLMLANFLFTIFAHVVVFVFAVLTCSEYRPMITALAAAALIAYMVH